MYPLKGIENYSASRVYEVRFQLNDTRPKFQRHFTFVKFKGDSGASLKDIENDTTIFGIFNLGLKKSKFF